MAVASRYQPSWPPGEATFVGMSFAALIPPGVIIEVADLEILTNTDPSQPTAEWTQQPCEINNRTVWCYVAGGYAGTDYQFRWTVTDSKSHTWSRTAFLLCAEAT